MKRYFLLYLMTLSVLLPIDLVFLGFIAKNFYASQVGDMLGPVRLAPAILFYLIYIAGIVVFVNGASNATWSSALVYGALFGLFCYATFDLTSLAILKTWSWPVAIVDILWGAAITGVAAAAGLTLANGLTSRL